MSFQVNDHVVHPVHGVGRVTEVATKRFFEAEARLYYEVAVQQGTVWVPAATAGPEELRALTPRQELDRYRDLLASRPQALSQDHRQRRLDLTNRLKPRQLQGLCEIVRDLSARSWHRPLSEADAATLRQARDGLCQEWAAAAGVSPGEASREVEALLLEGRRAHGA
jgi:CarD family transcriptional regulator